LALGLFVASSYFATQMVPNIHKPPGFLMGLVDGFISLFSLLVSLFLDIRIYGFPNSGIGYDAGFVLGAALFYGGIALAAPRWPHQGRGPKTCLALSGKQSIPRHGY
jgi:hypothetical protein